MKIRDIMTKEVLTIDVDELAEDACNKMAECKVHHLVVVKGATFVGVVSERDLGGKNGQSVREGKTVGDFTSRNVITASPNNSIQDASLLLRGYNIGCLPVIENGDLAGIITISDLLELLERQTIASRS